MYDQSNIFYEVEMNHYVFDNKTEIDLFNFPHIPKETNDDFSSFHEKIHIKSSLFSTNKELKSTRRDYYIKNIKVLALSKWLIATINLHLKETYKIKQKMQKPTQTFITETNIMKNKSWMDLTIEEMLTKNFAEFYSTSKLKNMHWEKKREKNMKIFTILQKKHKKVFEEDNFFKRTMKNVLSEYIQSEQFIRDKNNKKTFEEQLLFDHYANGDRNTPSIVNYFEITPQIK